MVNVQAVLTMKSPPTVAICPHFTSMSACPSFSTANIPHPNICLKFILHCPLTRNILAQYLKYLCQYPPFFILFPPSIIQLKHKALMQPIQSCQLKESFVCNLHCELFSLLGKVIKIGDQRERYAVLEIFLHRS